MAGSHSNHHLDVDTVGRVAAQLLCTDLSWVQRRKERVTFVDDIVVRGQESVDLVVPENLPSTAKIDDTEYVHLPVMVLRKAPRAFLDFDFKDRCGAAVSLPPRELNGAISAAALRARAEHVLGVDKLPAALAQALTTIAIEDPPTSLDALEPLLRRDDAAVGVDPRATLAADSEFRFLARLLAWASVLAAPIVNIPGHGALLKLAYSEPINLFAAGFTREVQLGWDPLETVLDLPFIGGGTYHLEVHPPDGLEIVWGRMVFRGKEGAGTVRAEKSGRSLHLYVPDARDKYRGAAQFFVQAPTQTFVSGGYRAAIVVAAVLTLFVLFAGQLGANNTSAGAFLLLFPGLIATYVFRPGEHLLTSRLLRLSRRALIISAGCAYLAAVWLLAAPEDKTSTVSARVPAPPAETPSATPSHDARRTTTTRSVTRETTRGRPSRTTRSRTTTTEREPSSRSTPPPSTTQRLVVSSESSQPSRATLQYVWVPLALVAWAMVAVMARTRKRTASRG